MNAKLIRRRPSRMWRTLIVGASLMAVATVVESARSDETASPARVGTWQRWEHTLTSARDYDNPYADTTLQVTYTGPGNRTIHTYGFWDGGNHFRIRAAFPTPGSWRWETTCSDTTNTGLHHQHGTVDVLPYDGDNLLYRRGFLKVSENRRYLAFGDETPFLWMGDTAWSAPRNASDDEWDAYIADRKRKRFTLIQVAAAPSSRRRAGGVDRQGESPFTDDTCGRWNPNYWQSFENKIQRANEAGLVVLVVGLMEPVRRYPEASQACLFARNIVARLFGNFVLFSPSFDSPFMPLADEVGLAARQATSVHLITQHPGTPSQEPTPTWTMQYYDRPYLDIAGVQTGHNRGNLSRCAHHAIEWILHAFRHEPHKPVVNVEALYDGDRWNDLPAVGARSLGWRTWLSGAAGYTYGGGGIWRWVNNPEKQSDWRKGLQRESAFQMQYLHDFLAGIEWWRLQPAHDLIRNQPDDVIYRMVLAKSVTGDLAVAYLPDNEAIEVDVSAFPAPLAARWFDPVHGNYSEIAGHIENRGIHRFTPPAKGDWALLLKTATLPARPADGDTSRAQAEAPAKKATGPLRVHPTNPRYFTDCSRRPDASPRAVLLAGCYTWPTVQDWGPTDPPAPFDYNAFLELLRAQEHNYFRMFRFELTLERFDPKTVATCGLAESMHCAPHPWPRVGPGLAHDGKLRFDLTRFDESYFQRLRSRVQSAQTRGIYVGIMLFEGWHLKGSPQSWPYHPFHRENNINGIDADANGNGQGEEIHSLAVAKVWDVQRAYIRKLVETVNDLDNVLFETANESAVPGSAEWQYETVREIKRLEATLPRQHPVGMGSQAWDRVADHEALWKNPGDWTSVGSPTGFDKATDPYMSDPPAADGRKVSLLDTDHLGWSRFIDDAAFARAWVWKAFTRGHNPILMENLAERPGWVAARAAMGQVRRIAEQSNLAAMIPHDELSSTRYCLADPEHEFVVFQPEEGQFTVELPRGRWLVEWLNPQTGVTTSAPPIQSDGGKQPFTPPFAGPAVLRLR